MDDDDKYWERKKANFKIVDKDYKEDVRPKPIWAKDVIKRVENEPRAKNVSPLLQEWLNKNDISVP